MGIDRIHEWLSKFGYGQSTGIDLNEEYAGGAAEPGVETAGT
ncbi:cell elongation, e phase; peptidoglycan synthetase; penicillin-binding protein 2 [Klebsiella michiganensis]|nr:cell elongation, e phase; peptidoglycan synthetase; penicillin-binding protein 2 [Klebsiella michiganensis]